MAQDFTALCYVDGAWIEGGGEEIKTVSPSNGKLLGTSRAAGPELTNRAISAARTAFDDGEWSRLGGRDRGALLSRLADLMDSERAMLIDTAAHELGTPISTGPGLHVDLPVSFIRWFAEAASRGPVGGYEQSLPLSEGSVTASSILLRQPVGVVAAITAFNVPAMMFAYKLGAALAAGCSVVLLTSPKSVVFSSRLVELVERAGFPAGAVNFIFGSPVVTEQVVTSPEVNLVTFTGSAAVGSRIAALAAPSFKKLVLELGGKSPNIVLPGTDLEGVVPASSLRFTRNSGQACGATTRVLVPNSLADEYVERSSRFFDGLVVGDPFDAATDLGPLITREHLTSVEGYLDRARKAGAETPVGGHRPEGLGTGNYYTPTLITGLGNDSEVAREELFAPVGVVLSYDDVDEAVRIANDSRYGLNANVWGPTAEAIEVARRVSSGTVTVNGGGAMRPDAPWGGPRESGLGREGGEAGFSEFFELKHIQWPVR